MTEIIVIINGVSSIFYDYDEAVAYMQCAAYQYDAEQDAKDEQI